jgi:glycosyltransferase involved in cell wall biosynthesis
MDPRPASTASDRDATNVDVAVIVPVSERYDDPDDLYLEYKRAIQSSGYRYEFTYVLDGDFPDVLRDLRRLQEQNEPIQIIKLTRSFGEATALTAGFENSTGDIILTLPAYHQVEPSELPKLLKEIHSSDMVVARRFPRTDSRLNRLQTALFHWVLRFLTGSGLRDLGCSARAFRRQITMEIPVYGDQHRFLPLLAARQGYKIKELDLAQSAKDRRLRIYRLGTYPRRLLDLLTVFFLIKFTKKPLRFFGLIGVGVFLMGVVITIYLVIQRLFFSIALAERPALLLSSLLMVLGAQVFALGLIGELIIFTHAKDIKEYTIEEIVN